MRIYSRTVLLAASLLSIASAHGAVSPLGAAILAPVQFPPDRFSITGARLSILWGEHRDVYGLDFGVIGNMTEQNFGGIGISGIFNLNKGMATVVGLQAAGIANINVNNAHIYGLQIAAAVNSNTAESTLVGLEVALANLSTHTTVCGLQIGAYNTARDVYGFQIGVVNVAHALHGVQIGLLNFNQTGLFSVAPLLNVGF